MTFKILSLIVFISSTGLMAVLYLVPQFLENPSHIVLRQKGKFEIRQYEDILLSSVKVSGDQYGALRNGFKPLAGYIFAKERNGDKISMTEVVLLFRTGLRLSYDASFVFSCRFSCLRVA